MNVEREREKATVAGVARAGVGGERHGRGSETKRKGGKAEATGPRESWPASNYPHTRPEKRLLLIRVHGFPSNSPKRRPRGRSKFHVLGTTHYRRSKFLSCKLNRSPFPSYARQPGLKEGPHRPSLPYDAPVVTAGMCGNRNLSTVTLRNTAASRNFELIDRSSGGVAFPPFPRGPIDVSFDNTHTPCTRGTRVVDAARL